MMTVLRFNLKYLICLSLLLMSSLGFSQNACVGLMDPSGDVLYAWTSGAKEHDRDIHADKLSFVDLLERLDTVKEPWVLNQLPLALIKFGSTSVGLRANKWFKPPLQWNVKDVYEEYISANPNFSLWAELNYSLPRLKVRYSQLDDSYGLRFNEITMASLRTSIVEGNLRTRDLSIFTESVARLGLKLSPEASELIFEAVKLKLKKV